MKDTIFVTMAKRTSTNKRTNTCIFSILYFGCRAKPFLSARITVSRRQQAVVVQGSAKRRSPGLVTFVTALAYHFCPALPAAFTQPGKRSLEIPCTGHGQKVVPRLRECCRQSQAEVVSKSSSKIHQTWGPPFSRAL